MGYHFKTIPSFLSKKKFKKVSVSHLIPVLVVEKWLKKTKQKTTKMNLVPATETKAKKNLDSVAGTKNGV